MGIINGIAKTNLNTLLLQVLKHVSLYYDVTKYFGWTALEWKKKSVSPPSRKPYYNTPLITICTSLRPRSRSAAHLLPAVTRIYDGNEIENQFCNIVRYRVSQHKGGKWGSVAPPPPRYLTEYQTDFQSNRNLSPYKNLAQVTPDDRTSDFNAHNNPWNNKAIDRGYGDVNAVAAPHGRGRQSWQNDRRRKRFTTTSELFRFEYDNIIIVRVSRADNNTTFVPTTQAHRDI